LSDYQNRGGNWGSKHKIKTGSTYRGMKEITLFERNRRKYDVEESISIGIRTERRRTNSAKKKRNFGIHE